MGSEGHHFPFCFVSVCFTGKGAEEDRGSILASHPAAPGCSSEFDSHHSRNSLKWKIIDVAEVNQQCCSEESGLWLENVNRTHLVLASGKPGTQKNVCATWGNVVRQLGDVLAQLVGEDVLRVEEVVGQNSGASLRVEPGKQLRLTAMRSIGFETTTELWADDTLDSIYILGVILANSFSLDSTTPNAWCGLNRLSWTSEVQCLSSQGS